MSVFNLIPESVLPVLDKGMIGFLCVGLFLASVVALDIYTDIKATK